MAWFILGLCLIGALLLAGRVLLTADPKKLARIIRLTGGTLLGVGALALLAFGRPMLAGLLGMGALLAFGRPIGGAGLGGGLFGILGSLFGGQASGPARGGPRNGRWGGGQWGQGGPAGGGPRWHDAAGGAGNSSQVQTAWLRMTLEHDTGEMSGTVLQGRFRGSRIEQLQAGDLIVLLRECEVEDPESVTLLEAYLDRTIGPEWRRTHGGSQGAGQQAGGQQDAGRDRTRRGGRQDGNNQAGNAGPGGGRMSIAEAREILNVAANASDEDVREAHRRLMKKLHPDHGGSNYLAGKINEAKDVLLGT